MTDDAQNQAPPPRRRRRRIVFAVILVAIAAWIGREVWWIVTATPAPIVDYGAELERLAGSHQPPGDNAWSDYTAIIADLRVITDEADALAIELEVDGRYRNGTDFSELLVGPLVETPVFAPEWSALEAIEQGDLPQRLDRLAASPRAVRPISVPAPLMTNFMLPDLGPSRRLALARLAALRQATVRGDEAGRVRALEHALAVARVTGSQPTLIERLVGHSITLATTKELRYGLIEHPPDAPTIEAMIEALDRQALRAPASTAFEAERMLFRDTVQWTFTDDGHGDGRIDLNRLGQLGAVGPGGGGGGGPGFGRIGGLLMAGKVETLAKADEFFDGMVRNSGLEPAARRTEGFDSNAFHASLGRRHFMLRLLVPSLDKALAQDDRVRRDDAVTRALLAIELFRARNGRLPATLAELVPGIVSEVPVDPATGTPFRYRVTPDDIRGPSYVLAEGADDGSRADEVTTEVRLNLPRPQTD